MLRHYDRYNLQSVYFRSTRPDGWSLQIEQTQKASGTRMNQSMLWEGNQPGKTEDASCKVPAINIRKTETDRVGASREGEWARTAGPISALSLLQDGVCGGSRAATGSWETLLTGTPRDGGDAAWSSGSLAQHLGDRVWGQPGIFCFCHILTRFKIQHRAKSLSSLYCPYDCRGKNS